MTTLKTRLLLSAALLSWSGCSWDLYTSYLDVTCLDDLCGWEVEQGTVARIGTWHPNEYGISLSDLGSTIGRPVPVVENTPCLRFKYLSAVETSGALELRVDFNDDGTDEIKLPLPSSNWKPQDLSVRTPKEFRRLRIHIAKVGAGVTEIAQFDVQGAYECYGGGPAQSLQNGAECSFDATCASNRCVSGRCSACGVGGCMEGEACRADGECLDGGCAGGVCRACAKLGTCGAGERCTNATQCGEKSCIAGSQPNLTMYPSHDATCGDCDSDDDCSGGKCALGRCSECVVDADCTGGRSCRYFDLFDAAARGCVPKLSSQLPRGALCESDNDCKDSLRCGAGTGRARRCGVACGSTLDCAPKETCIAPGVEKTSDTSDTVRLMAAWNDPTGRIATCYPAVEYAGSCSLHQQCLAGFFGSNSCCAGSCSSRLHDLFTAECSDLPRFDWLR